MTKKKKTVAETKKPSTPEQTNRLIHEKSPYLLSHAHNPVDWHAWGPEAFLRARDEDKPVFLSIGYSTCHWCHVMARESFEDPEVAALLNDTFINIKVDREERPDIDQIYMAAAQMLTGRGGWPLSVVMTPEKRPFFAATYIPKVSRYGMVGLMDLVPRIREVWMNQRDTVVQSAEEIANALQKLSQGRGGTDLEPSVLVEAKNALSSRYDRFNGGFGQAPKFPTPHNLMFLLRYYYRTGEEEVLDMVEETLLAMRRGGIYDHLGFGFHRYSTDQEWRVPHFEKMLYDNALLAIAYLEAYQMTGRDKWRDTAEEIFAYVLRDMRDSRGGFYSAEDADSEGVEGKFYLWSEDEIRRLLSKEEADLVISFYNVRKEGNFIGEPAGSSQGMNILHVTRSPREFFTERGLPENETRIRLERARKTLYQAREDRIHPDRDDKILTDWNGLMIAALALGGRVLNNPTYIRAAQKAAAFIARNLFSDDGQLLHRYRAGEAAIPAHLDDYAYLVFGLLELYFATYEPPYLQMARELTAKSIAEFWDEESGGFYFTQRAGEDLLIRSKEIYDGAIPSGNSVFMHNLLRMARLTGDAELEEKGWQISRAFSDTVRESPYASMYLMVALDFAFGPTQEVVVVGERNSIDTGIMIDALGKNFLPRTVVFFRPIGGDTAEITGLAPFTATMSGIEGKATAYVCTRNTCQIPTTEVSGMIRQLEVRSPRI